MNFKAAMVGAGSTSSESSSSGSTVPPTGGSQAGGSQAPPHIALSENSLQITIHKLNGKNYLEWAQSVRLVIDGKSRLGHWNGEVKSHWNLQIPNYKQ